MKNIGKIKLLRTSIKKISVFFILKIFNLLLKAIKNKIMMAIFNINNNSNIVRVEINRKILKNPSKHLKIMTIKNIIYIMNI